MIKLRADWHERCESCGTTLVVDFLDRFPMALPCPWCGATVLIEAENGQSEARTRLVAALRGFEAQANEEFTPT